MHVWRYAIMSFVLSFHNHQSFCFCQLYTGTHCIASFFYLNAFWCVMALLSYQSAFCIVTLAILLCIWVRHSVFLEKGASSLFPLSVILWYWTNTCFKGALSSFKNQRVYNKMGIIETPLYRSKWNRVGCVSVPKLVLRDIDDNGRVPPGLCPTTAAATHPSTKPTIYIPFVTTGNRSTVAGSGVDSEYHLHRSSPSPVLPTVPSEYGR